ncbi:MAG TPA: mucoidy inhibitor MuiA family protein [Candidatus Omnitrophota bacterium]|nr:mucoidy inhibitor MuiA family protein [Candidatus Omnitrophota bacterium]HPT07664.1 mucoidy inhibitor MuiA family protein [Candidatus Omnitrophota bacterium]
MKKRMIAVLGIAAVLTFTSQLWAKEITAESNIIKVTVYPNAALVTRKVMVNLPVGIHTIMVPGIIPYFDENTLRITGQGTEEIKIYGAQAKKEFLTEIPSERLKEITDQIQKINDQMRVVNNRKEILEQKKAFLDSLRLYANGQLPKELVTKMPQTSELESLLKFYDERLSDNYAQQVESDAKLRELQKTLDALQAEQAQLSSGQTQKVRTAIAVEVESAKDCNAELFISYLVPMSAHWRPIYDARADMEKSQTEVVCYGLVSQNTGEDWTDVELSLTTSKPTLEGRMPEPHAYFIRPFTPPVQQYETYRMKKDYKGALLSAERSYGSVEGDRAGAINDVVMQEVKQKATIAYASTEQRGISLIYKSPRKVTIKTDNAEQKVPVFALNLTTDFVYFSNPAENPIAYLGAEVTNTNNVPLLTGKTNIFLNGDLVSSSMLENIRPQEKFNFYFGADEDVKVTRQELERKVDTILIGNIEASTIKITYKYKLTVENYKSKKILVNLFESLPVSQDERIKVKIGEVSLAPTSKDYKDRPGVWMWKIELAPGTKQEIFYTYTVERPRDLGIENIIN